MLLVVICVVLVVVVFFVGLLVRCSISKLLDQIISLIKLLFEGNGDFICKVKVDDQFEIGLLVKYVNQLFGNLYSMMCMICDVIQDIKVEMGKLDE